MTFAFLAHPRARLAEDMGRVWSPLGRVPERVYDTALRRLPVPTLRLATVHLAGRERPEGSVLLVPFGARHLLADTTEGRRRIGSAVDRAVRDGVDVVGLGALTAPVTAGGTTLAGRADVGVTNGNAYTAAVVHTQLRRLLDDALPGRGGVPRPDRSVAIVGATGSVGTALVRLVARGGDADRLVLVARSAPRLRDLAREVGGAVRTEVSTDVAAAADCAVVVLLTASADAVLEPAHLRRGAVVLDATQPRATSPDLVAARPDVLVVDGGLVEVPTLRLRGGNVGLPRGRTFACLAETMLLSLAGHRGHFCLGAPTLEQVDHTRALAQAHSHLGFWTAPTTSFGHHVHLPASTRLLRSVPAPRTVDVREPAVRAHLAGAVVRP
ncbi:NAD(P)-binding domain-containing protein [Thalassiella azotivora]